MAAFFFHNQSPSTSRVCPPNRGNKIPSSNTHLQFYCRQLHCLTWLAFLFHYFGLALAITVFDLVESPTKKRNSPKSVTEPDCCPEKKTKQFCAGVGIQGALWRKLTMVWERFWTNSASVEFFNTLNTVYFTFSSSYISLPWWPQNWSSVTIWNGRCRRYMIPKIITTSH